MIRHIFFDNDGTIVDSEILAVRSMLRRLAPYGFQMDEAAYARRFPGLLERDILKIIEEEYQITVADDFISRLHEDHVELFDRHLQAIPGMDTLLRTLQTPKSMVSNGSVEHVERCLERIGLRNDFDGLIFSAHQVARPKPYPDVYQHALTITRRSPEEGIVIEDSPTGVKAAAAAGMAVVGFLGAAHISDGHADALKTAGARYIAADAEELRSLLSSLNIE